MFILGAGRAGRSLARALRSSGVHVTGLHGRRADALATDPVSAGQLSPAICEGDVIVVAVQDDKLNQALDELLAASLSDSAVVLHLSGSRDPESLGGLRARGHACGTFHPLLPLVDPAAASELFRGGWVGLDGDADALAAGEVMAGALGANVLRIPEGAKPRYHAAAVFASNFPAVLAAVAERLLITSGVDAASASGATRSLIAGACANLARMRPADALTGPVVRGDVPAIEAHLEALRTEVAVSKAYSALTALAVETMLGRGGAEHAELDEIARLVGAARRPVDEA